MFGIFCQAVRKISGTLLMEDLSSHAEYVLSFSNTEQKEVITDMTVEATEITIRNMCMQTKMRIYYFDP